VCLVSPQDRMESRRPPLALLILASYLDTQGFDSVIIDAKVKPEEYSPFVCSEIKRIRPLAVGLTAFSHEIKETLELARKIKSAANCTIIVGGNHATYHPEDFIFKGSPIDYVVIGEGEKTFSELLSAMPGGEAHAVKSIAYYKNRLIKTEQRELMDINELPIPQFDKIDMDYYTRPQAYGIRYLPFSMFWIFTTRGCPWNCTFCSIPDIWKHNKNIRKIRYRDVKLVVDEAEMLIKKYKIDALYFYDDDFCVWRQRVIDLCQEIERRGLKFIWGCETRVDEVDDELARIMADAGCVQIDFGVESGSQRSLDAIRKELTVEQIKEAFRVCRKYGIRTFANFMFNFPDETESDVQQTFEVAKEIRATVVSCGILTPFLGSAIFNELKMKIGDYSVYKMATSEMHAPFRLAKHDLDMDDLVVRMVKSYNGVLNTVAHRSFGKYIKCVLKSKRRGEYIEAYRELAAYYFRSRLPDLKKGRLSRTK